MKTFFKITNWIFGLYFLFLIVISIWSEHILPTIIIIIAALIVLPPVRKFVSKNISFAIPWWLSLLLCLGLFILFNYSIFMNMGNPDSIYKNTEIKAELMQIYEKKMEEWPTAYEAFFIETEYGKVHVIASGPENAPPVMLLHASAMSGWSWLYNVEELNKHYRTYAIDTIGDANRSQLKDVNYIPDTGEKLADLYSYIMDSLNVEKAVFIGGSQGGFISTNIAIYKPERVIKLIPCGPMGYTGTDATVLNIILTCMYPIPPMQDRAFTWAFGDREHIRNEVREWFYLILEGVLSRQATPTPFTEEQFQQIKCPVLLILGLRDGLVGDPEKTKIVAQNISDVQVKILDTGHLISAEMPKKFNELVIRFIEE